MSLVSTSASRPAVRSPRRLALIASAGAFAVALGGLAVVPAHAAENTTTLGVPAGNKVATDLGTVPSDAVSVDVTFDTTAEASTDIKVLVGPENVQRYYFTAPAGEGPERTYTVPVTSQSDGTLTVASSDANVKVDITVVGYTKESASVVAPVPAPAPAPVPAPAPAPVPAPEPAPAPAPTPPTSGTPTGSNTGVPAGTALEVVNGDINVTTAGTVLNGLDVRGLVKISAPNVTIKNSIIRGRTMNGPGALINNLGGFSNLVITDTELFPTVASPDTNGIYGYNFTATRLNIHNVIDGIHVTGSNVLIEESWIHDHMHYTNDRNQGGSASHDDSIQIQAGNNVKVIGNRLTDSHSAAVQITQDTGKVSNFVFSGNYANNGACTVNIAEKSYGPLAGTVITDNEFGRDTKVANCAVIAKTTTKIDFQRNFYTDNTAVVIKKG
ncbi:hypothetical protein [Cryobacterium sp. PH29-G1]|uniref:hypothetical protein n=1 Tax=Cryobacterium sp. PH29-G1 TaxID=3046211 RepID=UPI0024BB5706|nr:hypothetical protein [Cryobacterium sp. PH29-G1]MDJ0349570.1 hypothetical protein [Cryobacterium sp. PH29-G1]